MSVAVPGRPQVTRESRVIATPAQLLFLRLQAQQQGRGADSLSGQSAGADGKTKSQQTESLVGCKRHTCFSCGKSGAKQIARELGLFLGWQGNSQSSARRENGSQ